MDRIFKLHPSAAGKIISKSGKITEGVQTYLKEWYANDREQIRSKYVDKGNWVEDDLIDFAMDQLGLGIGEKNKQTRSDDFFIGTPDVVLSDMIIDVKAAWSYKTLLDVDSINPDYEWQVRCYMELFGKSNAIVFHGLLDTPADVNYGEEVSWEYLPPAQRWIAFTVRHDPAKIDQIKAQIIKCREWLEEYDKQVKARIGRIINVD